MRNYTYKDLSKESLKDLAKRTAVDLDSVIDLVKPILKDVKENGIVSALKYSKQFGEYSNANIKVTEEEFNEAESNLDNDLKEAIDKAYLNIKTFHEKQIPKAYTVLISEGIECSREYRSIENVGLYIPGGSAVLFSTMLMLGIPAQIANCKRVVVCSPSKDGKIHHALLYPAKVCGIKEFYKIGGSQAIALMAYGSEEFQKVDKIFGPGNQYVTAAKMLASIDPEGCAIDMPAGPSEVLVISDEKANPSYVAADLLSQAEHGIDSQAVLVSTSQNLVNEVNEEILKQLSGLDRRELAEKSLESSYSLVVENIEQAIEFSNLYAPEHLILNIENPDNFLSQITNAGSVFIGEYSPESAGDYASGTNHTLPTSGYAKMYSGLGAEAFMKSITFQKLSKEGLESIADTIIRMAEAEELEAHANAVKLRMK